MLTELSTVLDTYLAMLNICHKNTQAELLMGLMDILIVDDVKDDVGMNIAESLNIEDEW